MNNSNSCTGLKFTFEAQSNSYTTPSQTPDIKESPPSSPGSEVGAAARGKRGGATTNSNSQPNDAKDFKIFQKNTHATHMMGNQLNPTSSMAQKMSDQLYMEMEAHNAYNNTSALEAGQPLIGPTFPGKQINNVSVPIPMYNQYNRVDSRLTQSSSTIWMEQHRNNQPAQPTGPSLSSMLGGTGQPTATGNTPQSLEQLLERQWEQGSQFLMEQAQHFDSK